MRELLDSGSCIFKRRLRFSFFFFFFLGGGGGGGGVKTCSAGAFRV